MMMRGMKAIGFWTDRSEFTQPIGAVDPRTLVDASWDATERARVVAYLKNGVTHETWRGFSYCRFECGRPSHKMGSRDLTDGVYVWPEGYAHYVEDHLVKPPADFITRVLSKP